jgi:cytochrome c peroxidase
MRRKRFFIAGSLFTAACALAGGTLLFPNIVSGGGAVVGPVPPPPLPPNIVSLTPVEQLGKFMLYDSTLSNPKGYACASCHIPETGFTGPSSEINALGCDTPGVVPGRVGNRKPYTYNYAAFSPEGPFFDNMAGVYIGGQFWDGRASDPAAQAQGPPVNPNEMNNTPATSPSDPTFTFAPLLVEKLAKRPYTPLFKQVYGKHAFKFYTPGQIYELFSEAVAAYEASPEINQFSSRYDASKYGVPTMNKYTLTASEERGRLLYFGQAQCFQCHSAANFSTVTETSAGKDTFTMYCYGNIGTPKNPFNPFYELTDPSNPGFNPLGFAYVDFGLGDFLYPQMGLPIANMGTGSNGQGDFLAINGLMLTPTTRNCDKRPSPDFVKDYMHNGFFKSLKQVVHFYNTRNLTTVPGEVINFTLPNPYANLQGTPLWPTPEVPSPVTLTNPTGALPLPSGVTPPAGTNGFGQIGNLGLTSSQEDDVVAFLATLTDGFTTPNPVTP